jgi:BASS family bile acid:Na+ symporter
MQGLTMLEKIILPLVLGGLMFGLGMSLTVNDFKRVGTRKKLVSAGLTSVLIVMPAIAWGVAMACKLEPTMAMGLILLAACPGGMFSNLVTHTARGDLALSMTLTIFSSMLYVLTIPPVVAISAEFLHIPGKQLSLSFIEIFLKVLFIVLLPVTTGMILRNFRPQWCARFEGLVRNIASFFVLLVFVDLGIEQSHIFFESGIQIAAAVIVLNILGWGVACLIALALRSNRKELIAIGVEHSVRQEGTGVFIAVTILGMPQMTVPLLLNSLFGLVISAVILISIQRRSVHTSGTEIRI